MEAFTKLAFGEGLMDIVPELAALLVIAALMFAFGLAGYRRRTVR
jgi:hypothetical protein